MLREDADFLKVMADRREHDAEFRPDDARSATRSR